MSLQRQRDRYLLIRRWKIVNGGSTNDIDRFVTHPGRALEQRFHHFASQVLLEKNLKKRKKEKKKKKKSSLRNQSLYDYSFAVQGSRPWNTMPAHLHQLTELATF